MSNLLFIYESYEPTNAELFKLLSIAKEKGYINIRKCICTQIEATDIDWCDVVLSVRSTSAFEWRLARYCKKLGKYWILMLDDDFLSLDKKYGKDGQGYNPERKTSLKKILKYTDCLLAVNEELAKKYVNIGKIKKYALINTPIDCSNMVKPGAYNEKSKIVFYVNDGTQNIFNKYIKPLFPILCKELSDKIAIYFISIRPDLKEYEGLIEIHYVPHMAFEDFLKYMENEHFDIGLAPLDDIGFSKYKYFNKYVEYTRAGIAGIYSDCDLYRKVVISGYNGILCNNSVDSWIDAISKLVNNHQLRVQIAKNAQKYATEHFTSDKIIDKLICDINELINYKAPHKKSSSIKIFEIKIHYWGFRIRGWIYTAYSCIRSGNTKLFFKRVASRLLK